MDEFDCSTPLHHYLKVQFRKNRSYGSTDRRVYRSWCYAWYRLGNALRELPFEERIFVAYYLVNGVDDQLSKELSTVIFKVDENEFDFHVLSERLQVVVAHFPQFKLSDITGELPKLSEGINRDDYNSSFLTQPSVFARILRGKKNDVYKELNKNSIPFGEDDTIEGCIEFGQSSNLDTLQVTAKGYIEIQDRSSQLVADAIPVESGQVWWDCCCGAGGKTLFITDKISDFSIVATDKREQILENFKLRLRHKNHNRISLIQADLEQPLPPEIEQFIFDGVIADVPCSGSGTWARTPENLLCHPPGPPENHTRMQQKIVSKTIPLIRKGGYLVYITCSVFAAENEEMVDWICSKYNFKVVKKQLVNGIDHQADSLFYAVLSN